MGELKERAKYLELEYSGKHEEELVSCVWNRAKKVK